MCVGPISCPSCTGHHRVEEQKGYVLFSDLFSKFPGDVALLFKKNCTKNIFIKTAWGTLGGEHRVFIRKEHGFNGQQCLKHGF